MTEDMRVTGTVETEDMRVTGTVETEDMYVTTDCRNWLTKHETDCIIVYN